MRRLIQDEAGQISILILALSFIFLVGSYTVGMFAEVLIAQQRLNTKADSIALAGAKELEFNQVQACAVSQIFAETNYGASIECVADSTAVEILISEPNPNGLFGIKMPNIHATSRAGIAN